MFPERPPGTSMTTLLAQNLAVLLENERPAMCIQVLSRIAAAAPTSRAARAATERLSSL